MTDFTDGRDNLAEVQDLRGTEPGLTGMVLLGANIALVLAFHLDAAYPAGPLAVSDENTNVFYDNGHRVVLFDNARIVVEHADGAVFIIDPLGADSEDWDSCVATAFANPEVGVVEVSEEVLEEVLASDAEVR